MIYVNQTEKVLHTEWVYSRSDLTGIKKLYGIAYKNYSTSINRCIGVGRLYITT